MSIMRGSDMAFSSGVRYFEAESSFGECALCLSLWTEPKEIVPCRHIYCKECIGTMDTCPQCRGPIERLNNPNPVIVRMLDRITGKCSACSWTGTRHQYLTEHKTCDPKQATVRKSSKRPAAPPTSAPSSPGSNPPKSPQPVTNNNNNNNYSDQNSPLDATVSSLNGTGSSEIAAMVDRYAEYFMESGNTTGTATQSSGRGTMNTTSSSSQAFGGSGVSPGPHVGEWDRLRELQAQQTQQQEPLPNYNGATPVSYMWTSGRPAAVSPHQQQQQQPAPPYQTAGTTVRRSSNARVAAAVAATTNTSMSRPAQPARMAEWKQDIVMTASDYGLSEKDFNFLVDHWTEFATVNERNGKPELRWRDACRLLRYLNLPSHPSDVMDLFETVMQSVETGSIPFHGLCLWMALNTRDSQKWYHLNAEQYSKLLAFAQILDVEKSGLFNLDQCKSVGEEYLMRDLASAEWQSVLPLLVEKAKDYRRQIPTLVASQAPGGTSLVTSSSGVYGGSFSAQDVKLPLHEVILLFVEFMEQHKQTPVVTQDMEMERQNLCMRISYLIRYYNPSAMNTLPQMLEAFRGEEESLLETLIAEYGPEPR